MTSTLEPEPKFGYVETVRMSLEGIIVVILMKLFPVREEKGRKTGGWAYPESAQRNRDQ